MKRVSFIRVFLALWCFTLVFLAGCRKEEEPKAEFKPVIPNTSTQKSTSYIGVFLPNSEEERWVRLAAGIEETIRSATSVVKIVYSDNNGNAQGAAIESAVLDGINIIILVAVDSDNESVKQALEKAKAKDIRILAYDRFVYDTPNIDALVTADHYLSGMQAAKAVIAELFAGARAPGAPGVPNIEIMMGAKGDAAMNYFYAGAMDQIMPYVDRGQINIPSGLKTLSQTYSVLDNRAAKAQMNYLLATYYADGKPLDAVLTADDSLALGVVECFEERGLKTDSFPLITGVGGYELNRFKIDEGKQLLSVYADTADAVRELDYLVSLYKYGKLPKGLETVTFDNREVVVPANILKPGVYPAPPVEAEPSG